MKLAFWRKDPEPVEPILPTEDELACVALLNKIGLPNIQQLLKDCREIMVQKDIEQVEFLLNIVKPVMEKRLKEGFTYGSVDNLELDYEKYRLPTKLVEILSKKHGLHLSVYHNGKHKYGKYGEYLEEKPTTALTISYSISEVK